VCSSDLTRREYLDDKGQLRQAIARQRGARLAQQKLDAGDPEAAWAISRTTALELGDNLALIEVAKQAAEAAASPAWMDQARQRQDRHERALMP